MSSRIRASAIARGFPRMPRITTVRLPRSWTSFVRLDQGWCDRGLRLLRYLDSRTLNTGFQETPVLSIATRVTVLRGAAAGAQPLPPSQESVWFPTKIPRWDEFSRVTNKTTPAHIETHRNPSVLTPSQPATLPLGRRPHSRRVSSSACPALASRGRTRYGGSRHRDAGPHRRGDSAAVHRHCDHEALARGARLPRLAQRPGPDGPGRGHRGGCVRAGTARRPRPISGGHMAQGAGLLRISSAGARDHQCAGGGGRADRGSLPRPSGLVRADPCCPQEAPHGVRHWRCRREWCDEASDRLGWVLHRERPIYAPAPEWRMRSHLSPSQHFVQATGTCPPAPAPRYDGDALQPSASRPRRDPRGRRADRRGARTITGRAGHVCRALPQWALDCRLPAPAHAARRTGVAAGRVLRSAWGDALAHASHRLQ